MIKAINIETTAAKISEIDANTPVTFSIEEVPVKAVQKLLSDGADKSLMAIEDGKQLGGDELEAVKAFVRKSMGYFASKPSTESPGNGQKWREG